MRRRIALWVLGAAALVVVLAVVLARVADAPSDASEVPSTDVRPDAAMIARGKYLAAAGDCVSCHSVPGGPRWAGGTPFKLPFGTVYGSNITPDKTYGIGSWSDADFIAAMHRGIAKGGGHLYPAFPYSDFTKMPVGDVLAVKAYLFSLKPVAIASKENQLIFPFNQTWGIAYWNLLFNPKRRFEPDVTRSAELNRGAYLVEGPGHCDLCHTPLNVAFAVNRKKFMAGTVVDGSMAYNISSDRRWGIGAWSQAELARYLGSGHVPGRGAAGASMALVVQNSTSQLTPADLSAIAAYLKQIPAQRGTVEVATRSAGSVPNGLRAFADDAQGRAIYMGACMGCHGVGGSASAVGGTLSGHPSVNDPSGIDATLAVAHGVELRTRTGNVFMPGFSHAYSDAEVAAVVRYVDAAFGQANPSFDAKSVAKIAK